MKNILSLLVFLIAGQIYAQNACNADFTYVQTANTPTYKFTQAWPTSNTAGTWSWDFGDGSTSNQYNPVHTFAQPGTYNVCLTVTSSLSGCVVTTCQTIVVGPSITSCQASFVYSLAAGSLMSYHFQAVLPAASVTASYLWNFGDGTTSTEFSPNHNYAVAGVYTACLTIAFPNGCTATSCQTITVGSNTSGCQVDFTYLSSTATQMSFHFQVVSLASSAAASYLWTFGDGTSSTEFGPNHTYAAAGVYTACLTVTYLNGCTATSCQTIVVGPVSPACHAKFVYTHLSANALTYKFTQINATAAVVYTSFWDFGDGTTSTDQNPVHTFTTPGPHTVCLTVIYPNGCTDTYCVAINSFAGPGSGSHNVQMLLPMNQVGGDDNLAHFIRNFPNPVRSETNLEYVLAGDAEVEIEVFDQFGRLTLHVASELKMEGSQTESLRFDGVQNGIYLVKMRVVDQVYFQKIAVVK